MSHWDGHQTVRWPARSWYSDRVSSWLSIDCGCCTGLQWGGEQPRECHDCKGYGVLAVHIPTRTLALYPGGPLAGCKLRQDELVKALQQVSSDAVVALQGKSD